ncbi:hypothetical protein J1605_010177 [Eschrichtius robustus]|uniref:Transmembrane protein 131-like n=1 Tax=Eschrichtius robustus TaxID=9764 RepID=A0AB34GSN8_ESCRO|nr:hypothetical protein J1605_010177 [Eschrichtius robustus]
METSGLSLLDGADLPPVPVPSAVSSHQVEEGTGRVLIPHSIHTSSSSMSPVLLKLTLRYSQPSEQSELKLVCSEFERSELSSDIDLRSWCIQENPGEACKTDAGIGSSLPASQGEAEGYFQKPGKKRGEKSCSDSSSDCGSSSGSVRASRGSWGSWSSASSSDGDKKPTLGPQHFLPPGDSVSQNDFPSEAPISLNLSHNICNPTDVSSFPRHADAPCPSLPAGPAAVEEDKVISVAGAPYSGLLRPSARAVTSGVPVQFPSAPPALMLIWLTLSWWSVHLQPPDSSHFCTASCHCHLSSGLHRCPAPNAHLPSPTPHTASHSGFLVAQARSLGVILDSFPHPHTGSVVSLSASAFQTDPESDHFSPWPPFFLTAASQPHSSQRDDIERLYPPGDLWPAQPVCVTSGFGCALESSGPAVLPAPAPVHSSSFIDWNAACEGQFPSVYCPLELNDYNALPEENINYPNGFPCPAEVQTDFIDHSSQSAWNSPPNVPTAWGHAGLISSPPYLTSTRSLSPMSGLFGSIWAPQSDVYENCCPVNPTTEHSTHMENQAVMCKEYYPGFNPFRAYMDLDIWTSTANRSANFPLSRDSSYCGNV